jgi:ligand-binding sensor domain-containing protein/signal transduction histidine kinase
MPNSVVRRTVLMLLRCLILIAMAASCSRDLFAAAPDYLIDPWDMKDGLPSSTVTSIEQTPEGYLWIGTYNGLARFDGVRFVVFDPVNTPELSHPRIQGLYLDATGTLWISTYRGGLTSYRNGKFKTEMPAQAGFDLHTMLATSSSNQVTFVSQFGTVWTRDLRGTNQAWRTFAPPSNARPFFQCADSRGVLWFLDREAHILRFSNGEFQEMPADSGLGTNRVFNIAADAAGNVWVAAENTIARWSGKKFETMTPTNGEANLSASSLLFPTRDGAIWVWDGDRLRKMIGRRWAAEAVEWRGLLGAAGGRAMGAHEGNAGGLWFNHYGNGLFHILPDGTFQHLTARDGLPGDRIGAWFQSRDGGVWIGMDHGGLARLRERKFQVLGRAEGLTARAVLSVCEDNDGVLWIGTSGGGLCRWSNDQLTSFPVGNNASANFVFSVFPQPGGGLWLSGSEAENLFRFDGKHLERAPWDPHGVKAILEDQSGRVWLGTKSGLAWWSEQGRHIFSASDGLVSEDGLAASSAIRALAEAPDGTVWCGSDDGTLYRCEPEKLQAFRPTDSHGEEPIWSLLADKDGAIWAGTFRGGLLRFKNGEFKRFTAKEGLPVQVIVQILEDDQGQLWLGTHQGIFRVSKAALNACADGKKKSVDCASYGILDGLPTLECSDGYQPTCWHGSDGELWFATVRGLVSVNPDELTGHSQPPPVVIEDFQVDGEPVAMDGGKVVVPPGHIQFEFQFTALSFGAPDKTRFRYRMDNVDNDWVDAGTRRAAPYAHLRAGNYRFRVIACNSDGIWSTKDTAIAFTVKPFFYETWWFYTLVTTLSVAAIAFTVRRIATRKYRKKLARLEQQHAIERDRARIAKDIHDDIGAGLTQITLLTELARREPEQTPSHLDRISGSARQLTRAMDEIVWAVDPQHDTFNGLMDYISAYAEDYLRVAGIRCRMDLPNTLPTIRVEAEVRYNLFLAVKEVLNNIVKHAQASEVWLRLGIEPESFALVIEDNGRGLPMSGKSDDTVIGGDRIISGAGLSNLEKRLATIGGQCKVSSEPGKGTRVEMRVRISGTVSPVVAIARNGNGN